MKSVTITEDVRILGVSYSPDKKPIEVDDKVADELIKIGCAKPAGEESAPDSGEKE